MKTPKLFSYLDYIWASHGIPCLAAKSKRWTRVLCAIKIFNHLFLIQHLIGPIVNVITTGDLRNVFPTFYIFFSYLTYVIMSSKLRKIVDQIISFGNRLLTSKNKRHLIGVERYSLVCFIVWQVLYTSNSFAYQVVIWFGNGTANFDRINYWIDPPESSFVLSIIYDLFFSFSVVHVSDAQLVAAVMVYCYLAYVIYKIQASFLDYVMNERTTIRKFRIIWTEIVAIKDALEEDLNSIPLITIVVLFQNFVTVVVVFSATSKAGSSANQTLKQLIYWAFQILIAIPILFTPFLVSWINKKINDRFKSVQKKMVIEGLETDTESVLLMEDIKSSLDLNLTGYGMFKIDKELILPFFSSVITFSVLFMQMTKE